MSDADKRAPVANVKSFGSDPCFFVLRLPNRYFGTCCFFLASARRSVFFRRVARFLALFLPLLCPIRLNLRPPVTP